MAAAIGAVGSVPSTAVSDSNAETIIGPVVDPEATLISPSPMATSGPKRAVATSMSPGSIGIAGLPSGASPMPRSLTSSWIPDFGPRYEVLGILGQGGMGAVFKARDLELDRIVALKLLRPELVPDSSAIQRFKQELLLASKVSHRNILRIHDLGDANGVKYISMAYIEGQDLNKLIAREGRLPVERAVMFSRQILDALDAAHREAVVHRDLKPQNMMVAADDHLYVMDFGLAKSVEADTRMTMTGQVVGTPQYMAPEQVEGGPIDHRADLYAFGLILDEMLTGELVFKADSTFHLMLARIREAPRSPRTIIPELPEYLERIVMRCLMRSPDERYQSAREILNDLDTQAAQAVKEQATLVLSQVGAAPGVAPKKPRAAALARTVAVIVLGVSSLLLVPGVRLRVMSALGAKTAAKRIAVLPLKLVGDSSMDYIAAGIGEALTAELGDVSSIQVAAPSAVQKLKANITPDEAAANLGADYIVAGVVTTGSNDQLGVALTIWAKDGRSSTVTKQANKRDLLAAENELFKGLLASPALHLKASNDQSRTLARSSANADAEDLYLQGRNLLSGQLDDVKLRAALDKFEGAAKLDSSFALAYTGIADSALRLFKTTNDPSWAARAQSASAQAEQLNDSLPEVHFAVGSVYAATGKTAAAVSELKNAVKLAPNSDDAYRRLADAYKAAGDKPNAIAAYKKAIELNPYYWFNYNVLGTAYWGWGDYVSAIEQFQHVIQHDKNNAAAYRNLGAAYSASGNANQAIRALETSLQLEPNHQKTLSNLGTVYFFQKRYADAVRMFEKAVQLNPNYELGVGNLADAYRWSGRSSEANAAYDKAIALGQRQLQVNGKDGATTARLATYFAKRGDLKQAEMYLARAQQIDSSNRDLAYYQAQIDAIAGNNDDALRALEQAFRNGRAVQDAAADPEFGKLAADARFKTLLQQYSSPAK